MIFVFLPAAAYVSIGLWAAREMWRMTRHQETVPMRLTISGFVLIAWPLALMWGTE